MQHHCGCCFLKVLTGGRWEVNKGPLGTLDRVQAVHQRVKGSFCGCSFRFLDYYVRKYNWVCVSQLWEGSESPSGTESDIFRKGKKRPGSWNVTTGWALFTHSLCVFIVTQHISFCAFIRFLWSSAHVFRAGVMQQIIRSVNRRSCLVI